MSKEPKSKKKDDEKGKDEEKETAIDYSDLSKEKKQEILTNIPGVGPKTAEKLVEAEYDTIEEVLDTPAEELAEAIQGLSVSKAEGVLSEAADLQEKIESGEFDPTKPKRSKRKKAPEPDPDIHELPPGEEIKTVTERTSLKTGLEEEKKGMGVPAGPKWLTRFEKARIIGARALQISMGAPVLIDMTKAPNELFTLAELELASGVLPMTVRRSLPTGEFFDIPLQTLLENTRLDVG